MYTSRDLTGSIASTKQLILRDLFPGYRQVQNLPNNDEAIGSKSRHGDAQEHRNTLLFGRLYLPRPTLEALYLRRVNPRTQLRVSCVSDASLPNKATLLAQVQHNAVRHSTEYMFSTDSALLGIQSLYNFGALEDTIAPSVPDDEPLSNPKEATASLDASIKPQGRFSAGGEVYYGLLNKSGGLSTGLRYATLPRHPGFPYTMTCTLNPLMGSLSSTYSVLASPLLALSSRFDFNAYSYESDLQVGFELWRPTPPESVDALQWAKVKLNPPSNISNQPNRLRYGDVGEGPGCLKAALDQKGSMAFLWAGKIKQLVYNIGLTMDLNGGENFFKGFGIEVHYSS